MSKKNSEINLNNIEAEWVEEEDDLELNKRLNDKQKGRNNFDSDNCSDVEEVDCDDNDQNKGNKNLEILVY